MIYTPEEIAKLLANRPNQPHYINALVMKCIAAERQAIIAACRAKADEWQQRPGRWQHHQGAAIGALACADLVEERGRK